jgi:hypothetical protein
MLKVQKFAKKKRKGVEERRGKEVHIFILAIR